MIEEHKPLDHVNALISYVSDVQQLQPHDGEYNEFPDRTIASFHNHVGNVKQFVSDDQISFNAAEQFLSQKSAINEVQAALEDLFLLHHKDALETAHYQTLVEKLMEIDESLRAQTDSDYAHL